MPSLDAAHKRTELERDSTSYRLEPASLTLPSADWRQRYFEQSYALSFNGINDYVLLPNGILRQSHATQDVGFTVDIMFLAHAMPNSRGRPSEAPGGGMLFGLQDREFGRSRRAARLSTFPLLYIGKDGRLHSALKLQSLCVLADGKWHRATVTLDSQQGWPAWACLYLDGRLHTQFGSAHSMSMHDLPSYAVLGSGVTEGYPAGGSVPVYNCHTFHGLIDELRVWARPLQSYEASLLISHLAAVSPRRVLTAVDLVFDCLQNSLLSMLVIARPKHKPL